MLIAERPRQILQEDRVYTFSQIFELNFNVRDILSELGYSYEIVPLALPRAILDFGSELAQVREQMLRWRPRVSLDSEIGRREFYVSPVIFHALNYADFDINIEYSIMGERLHGSVDYLLRGANQVIVVEAKLANMERGFAQLAAEMIALSEYLHWTKAPVYGVVTTGDLWQFGLLDVAQRAIQRDLRQYLLPGDLDELFGVLLGLMHEETPSSSEIFSS